MDKKVLILAGSFLGVSLGIFFLMASLIKNFIKSKNKIIIYSLLFILAFSLVSLIGYEGFIESPLSLFITFQAIFLFLGIIHSLTIYIFFEWTENKSFFPELGFTFFVWLLGAIPFILILQAINNEGLHFLMLGATMFFFVPLFLFKTFDAAANIPLKDMKKWYFPVHEKIPDPSGDELKKPLVISFLMTKKPTSKELTHFRAKAPEKMTIGRLFYFFTDDYNEKNIESTIEYADRFGRPHGWLFYYKPKWYLLFTKNYLDPDLTVEDNSVRENSVIVCERVDIPVHK